MKTKKAFYLAFILTLLMMLTTVVASAASPSVTVSSAEAKAGETVIIQISIHNNPGIVGMGLDVSYDDQLSLANVADGGIVGDSVHTENYSLNPYRLTWANDTAKTNFSENGTLATLTFKVADNAPAGKYTVSVSYNNDNFDIFNVDAETVDFTVSNGIITVTEPIHTQHTWDAGKVTKTATCKEEGVKELTCTVCGEKKTEAIAKDASNHADYGTEVKGAKAATETAKGYTGDIVCKGCGAVLKKGEEIPIPDPIHTHTMTKTAAKAATCTETGNVEYYTCSGCKKTFSDAAGTKEITNVTIPAKGHSFGAWKVEKAATKTAEGLQSRTCSVCGKKETKAIPKLTEPTSGIIYDIGVNDNGHDFVGGKDQTTKQAKDNNKSAATEKAASGTKTANNGGKLIKTDAGKDTGDNGILLAVTGLVALAGAAFVVTRKKRS